MSNPFAETFWSRYSMWWRILLLSGMFFGISRIHEAERHYPQSTCVVIHNRANGHYYQWIPVGNVSFERALAWAQECHFAGRAGHLATITSRQENDLLASNRQLIGNAWIAASDQEQEGTWKWVAGKEAGETFYVVGDEPDEHGYSNWADNEPNDRDEEDFAVFGWMSQSKWNDLALRHGQVDGFLVEYPDLPEPDQLVVTTGNTHSPFFSDARPTVVGEKQGKYWQWAP